MHGWQCRRVAAALLTALGAPPGRDGSAWSRTSALVVITAQDDGPGSLRQMIRDAPDGATIAFDPVLGAAAITLTSGEITISHAITIAGPGDTLMRIGAGGASRVFSIAPLGNRVVLSWITVADGRASGKPAQGGGIRTLGDLVLRHVSLTANGAEAGGGSAPKRP